MRSSAVHPDMITGRQLERAVTHAIRSGSAAATEPKYNFRFDPCANSEHTPPGALCRSTPSYCAVCSLRVFCPDETPNKRTREEQRTLECPTCPLPHSMDKILDRRGGVTKAEYKVCVCWKRCLALPPPPSSRPHVWGCGVCVSRCSCAHSGCTAVDMWGSI